MKKYREHYRRTHPRVVNELRWLVPGAVWAMDHTKGPRGEDILSVRELVTGEKLVWERVEDVGVEEVLQVLGPLLEGDRPLVVKVDREGPSARRRWRTSSTGGGDTSLLAPEEARVQWIH